MLSFMREQAGDGQPGGQTTGANQRDGVASDNGEAQEYLTVAASSKNLRNSTILVAVLVAIGLGGLGYMIRQSQPQAASGQTSDAERTKIEDVVRKLREAGFAPGEYATCRVF